MNIGKLYGVGIGPGNPKYLTLRAAEVIRQVDVIFTVISKNASDSVSQNAVEYLEPSGEIHLLTFSMSRDAKERFAVVRANAEAIIARLKEGKDCAFATLGDAMTYSTFGYVLRIIQEALPQLELEIVPGVTSFSTLAATACDVLVENGEQLRVIPSFKTDMADSLEFPEGSTTILLKTYRSRKPLLDRLAREDNIKVYYGEHLSMDDQVLLRSIDEIAARPETYLSLMMVKKGRSA